MVIEQIDDLRRNQQGLMSKALDQAREAAFTAPMSRPIQHQRIEERRVKFFMAIFQVDFFRLTRTRTDQPRMLFARRAIKFQIAVTTQRR